MKTATVEMLRDREYWTPTEAALVLGRGANFWRWAFDDNRVDGYLDAGRRYIDAKSAREFLRRGCKRNPAATSCDTAAALKALREGGAC